MLGYGDRLFMSALLALFSSRVVVSPAFIALIGLLAVSGTATA